MNAPDFSFSSGYLGLLSELGCLVGVICCCAPYLGPVYIRSVFMLSGAKDNPQSEQRESEQRESEQRESEQRESEQRESEQRESEQRESEQREYELESASNDGNEQSWDRVLELEWF